MKATLIIFILFFSNLNETRINQGSVQTTTGISKNQVLEEDFKDYWMNLGKALRQNDMLKLDQYLNRSVIFMGREDRDPIVELFNNERIVKVLKIYRNGGFYDDLLDESISYEDFFAKNNSYEKEYKENADIQEIKDFTFKKMNGSWKLMSVYSNTK
jgi:hypothetical protein